MREINDHAKMLAVRRTRGLPEFNNLRNAVNQGYLGILFFELNQLWWQKAAAKDIKEARVVSIVIEALGSGTVSRYNHEPFIGVLNAAIIAATTNNPHC